MELIGITEKNLKKRGKDNRAFESEEQDQIYIDHDGASNVTRNEDKESNHHNKSFLEEKMEAFQECLEEHKHQIRLITYTVLAAGFVAIVITACVLNFQRAVGLLVIALMILFFLVWDWMMERYGSLVWDKLYPIRDLFSRNWFWMRWVMYSSLLLVVVLWLALDTAKQGRRQLMSFFGLLIFIFLMLLYSKHPFRWRLQTLLWGTGLQVLLGLLILRSRAGFAAVDWLGKKVETFMSYTDVGSEFVFGEKYTDHFFAFKAMPIVIFLSAFISILYHVGLMTWLICKLGYIMQVTMGTSPTESMAAAGNIFLGQTESPLLVRPYISKLTCSEIHAVMAGGFAGISGSVMGTFIYFGVEASHLLTASVMSAPSSLAIAKLVWPETETPRIPADHKYEMDKGDSTNVLEAASNGATTAVLLVANIISNIIAFLALLTFFNAVLSWLGVMLDCPELSFTLICSYLFMPISFLMGVSWEDSFIVGELLGFKTFINEFVAYQRLAKLIKLRKEGKPLYVNNVKQYLSVHSETIVTYALCGFANFASLGIGIGAMTALAPDRRADIANCAFRALVSGCVSSFMNACIAGILYVPEVLCPDFLNTAFNSTNVVNSTLITCCTELYNSVTVFEHWNVTAQGGFSISSLQNCCTVTAPKHFNCSLVL
ncbi:solute carrier family 28 member 3-like [Genypterus blacodes]|uniref:solute carrier family 28 member 3-like n=1 Tax=Genypterus blacodes TaxID=154954 RepID=UPI003F774B4B